MTDKKVDSVAVLPPLPASWSALSWRQLTGCWLAKIRYGGNPDVAQAAAFLSLYRLAVDGREPSDEVTGEAVYRLRGEDGRLWSVRARELSAYAQQTIRWFAYPYGDPGKPAVKDDAGLVIEESVDPVRGLVNPDWKGDAMQLPEETVIVAGQRLLAGSEWDAMREKPRRALFFALPQVALHNLTWQQYRSLQAIASQLFREDIGEDDAVDLQAQFMAHCLLPARDVDRPSDRFAPRHDFVYDSDRAEQSVAFWRGRLAGEARRLTAGGRGKDGSAAGCQSSVLFHIVFQVYQTALSYYAQVFPLLFNGGRNDKLQDALTGEVGTINAVMKYQGYTKPEEVYAENLPVILSTLNTMAEEAKQIEQMNARIKNKR